MGIGIKRAGQKAFIGEIGGAMKKTGLLLVLILPVLLQAQPNLIGRDVMPFGGCTNWSAFYNGTMHYFDSTMVDTLKNVFGINQMKLGVEYDTAAQRWARRGIYTYPSGYNWLGGNSYSVEPQMRFGLTTYFICQPESANAYVTKFKTMSGWPEGNYWAKNTPGIMLDELNLLLPNRDDIIDPIAQLHYSPYLKIALASSITDTSILIGTFRVFRDTIRGQTRDTAFVAELHAGDIINSGGNWLSLSQVSDPSVHFFLISNSPTSTVSRWIRFQFEISDSCPDTVYVDAFKVQDQYGGKLADRDSITAVNIKASVGRTGYQGKILGWFIKDTAYPKNYYPIRTIDSLTQVAMVDSSWTDSLRVRTASWLCSPADWLSYREYAKIAQPEMFWAYLYPIDWETAYAGNGTHGLQNDLNGYLADPCDSIRDLMRDPSLNPPGGWMYTPQYWWNGPPYSGDEPRRQPTKSEIRCITFIGLCYDPKGIMFYKFEGSSDVYQMKGLYEYGAGITSIGEVVRDDINPYIKAIDSTYMELTWDTAYAYNPAYGFDVPENSLIQGITAVNETPASNNPDLGWFQVGEYHDSSDQRYFMLVNRACSRFAGSGTEAPAVAATVWLKPTLSERAYYVIDLAQTLRHAGGDTGWVSIPETTWINYTADYYQFTTMLKAGEGRLYKVVEADRRSTNKQRRTEINR